MIQALTFWSLEAFLTTLEDKKFGFDVVRVRNLKKKALLYFKLSMLKMKKLKKEI